MNINYEDIITKANTRKDALKQVEAMLADAPTMLERLEAVSKWFKELSLAYALLDSEGQLMIPEKMRMTLAFRNATAGNLGRARYSNLSGHYIGIKSLVETDNV